MAVWVRGMGSLSALSVTLSWCGLVAVAFAAVLYPLAAFGRRVVVRQAATTAGSVTLSEKQPLPPLVGRLATWTSWVGLAFMLAYMGVRSAATGHPPYSDMFEYLNAFGTLVLAFYVIFERRYHQRTLGVVALPAALLILLLGHWLFSSSVETLQPALEANRLLAIHVACMVISYGALTVASAATALYLVQGDHNRYKSLPKARALEQLTYRAVLVGFPLLGLGIALGAYWANRAWGRYWGWDPKETTALVTWLVFAGYLHARSLGGWRGTRAAAIVMTGFGLIFFNIFIVNFFISGLHSYMGS
jgi:cytochrome c-type biogenesis protein CcsB